MVTRMSSEWHQLQQDMMDYFVQMVDTYEDYFLDTVWPAVTEQKPPAERLADYDARPPELWANLQETAPKLWARQSKDALTLREREQKKSLEEWQREQFIMQRAFMPQLQPFGLTPQREFEAGLNEPLPLQRTG